MREDIQLSFDPPSALITLNRPEVRNALTPEMVELFHQALDRAGERDDIAAVIVTGEGKAFCSGVDLRVLQKMSTRCVEEVRQDSRALMKLLTRIYDFPKPVIAAVNGPARGGGCGLISVCDIVIAVEGANFAYSETRVGFIPALVAVFFLRVCGEKRARELLLTGRVFPVEEAREIGLVNSIVDTVVLLKRAKESVESIAQNSPTAMSLTKDLIRDVHGLSLQEALDTALQLNVLVQTSEDFQEGLSSFLEKRTPQWRRK
ncbi:MAG: enoyl-CoA hydratase-related protein [Acidobacteriota bacterium]